MVMQLLYIMTLSFTSELKDKFSNYFSKCVRGYHLLNSEPIKESVWESINTQVLTHAGCSVYSQANGSHSSGSDISCGIGNLSNKSVKYDSIANNHFNISSYRLTSVCSASNPGNIDEIITEINKRKNFEYYSIIARDEFKEKISYDWFIIPVDYSAINPLSYNWTPMLGKRGKHKDVQIGWKTDIIDGSSMSITFSMSSQLWISLFITDAMKQYFIVANNQVKDKCIMDYVQLSDSYPGDL
jgi:hypothetical protein